MRSHHSTFALLVLLAVGSSTWAAEPANQTTFIISGFTSLPDVTMQGLPGAPLTDENGHYAVTVPHGWSGTVTPVKEGYHFDPPALQFDSVIQSHPGSNFRAEIVMSTISGSTGLPGVAIRGLPDNPVTDENGIYTVEVPYGWTGRVMPTMQGYRFRPAYKVYHDVVRNHNNEDYTADIITFTISGATGLPNVTMRGLPGNPITDADGFYTAQVEYGWSGAVTPEKEGHAFSPPQKMYTQVTHDCPNQEYVARVITFPISGNVGLDGVAMMGLPGHVLTDSKGNYSVEVPYGWNGTVKPEKRGCKFSPVSRQYDRVVTEHRNGNYQPVEVAVAPSSYEPRGIDVLVIPTTEVDPKMLAETREDMQIMVQILREMLSEPRMILGILYDYGDIFGRSDRGTRAFYLEGYGALFVMEVDFPFSFPSATEPEDEPAEATDPVWQRARQRLRSPGTQRTYDPAKGAEVSFEQFRQDLMRTLRHTANIRHIGPEENVTLTVVAQGGGRASQTPAPALDTDGNAKRDALGRPVYQPAAPTTTTDATVLTIRAKKADVDAFAAGQIDLAQFQQRVNIVTY